MKVTAINGNLNNEIVKAVQEQPIYWSDERNKHWFFDFKVNGKWVSSVEINNELTECEIDVF